MTRLIDADALKDWSEIVELTDDGGIDINDFEEKLESMPTVDAEPIIRCKKCIKDGTSDCAMGRWYYTDNLPFHKESWNKPQDYCSWAERKEE
jgi:hypothetical protein